MSVPELSSPILEHLLVFLYTRKCEYLLIRKAAVAFPHLRPSGPVILEVHTVPMWQAGEHEKREIGAEPERKVKENLGGFSFVLVFLNISESQEDTSPCPWAEEYRNTKKLASYLLKHQPRAEVQVRPTPRDSDGRHGNYVQRSPKM